MTAPIEIIPPDRTIVDGDGDAAGRAGSGARREPVVIDAHASTPYESLRWRLAQALERALGRLGPRLADYALVLPDLAHLFVGALRDERVSTRQKGELVALAVYLVSPVDLIPEALLGPLGLVDDVLVATRLLDTLLNRLPGGVVEAHWPGEKAMLARARALAKSARTTFSMGLRLGATHLARGALTALSGLGRALQSRLPHLGSAAARSR